MHFSAFPLLLLIASTICTSSARSGSRRRVSGTQVTKQALRDKVMNKQVEWVYDAFSYGSRWIPAWSDPDKMVEPRSRDRGSIVVKRVVVVPEHAQSLTGGQSNIEAPEEQILIELENLDTVNQLQGWCKKIEKQKSGEEATYFYIAMRKMGVPASKLRKVTQKQKDDLRENGIKEYKKLFKIDVAPEYNQDKYFAFPESGKYAHPMMWRNAQRE